MATLLSHTFPASEGAEGQPGLQRRRGHTAPLVALYFVLAFYRIGHQSLWVDEVLSLEYAAPAGSFFSEEIWSRGQGPLYFALLHVWGKLGTGELWLRSLSVPFGAVVVYLTYCMSHTLFDRRVAALAGLFAATSPFLIWYAQEARYVTLMLATSLLAMHAFHRALSENRRRSWVYYGCSLVLAITAFVSNVLLPAAHALYLVLSPAHRPLLRRWILCNVVVFALFAWWANAGQLQKLDGYWLRLVNEITASGKGDLERATERLGSGGAREFSAAALPYTFFSFSVGHSLGPSVQDLHVSRSFESLRRHAPAIFAVALVFGGLLLRGLFAAARRPATALFLGLWLAVPLLGALAVSATTAMAYNVRYAAAALPAYLILVAVGATAVGRRASVAATIAVPLLINALCLANYYHNPQYARDDARAAARYLSAVAGARDAILVVGAPAPIRHYYAGDAPLLSWSSAAIRDDSSLRSRLRHLASTRERVWLVTLRSWQQDPEGRVRAALDRSYPNREHQRFPGVDVYCYAAAN